MRYELWELSTGNLVGAYETEAAALHAVAVAVRLYGPASTATLALDDAEGEGRAITDGEELTRRALALDPAAASVGS